jgi:sigma54-dependent transcription regulator
LWSAAFRCATTRASVIGAIGIVLFDHPETTLQPLISKFAHLQRDLDDARRELATQRRTKYTFASFVGSSPAAVEVKRQARRAAQSSSPVLLLGETGTGKELLAHAIHAASRRARAARWSASTSPPCPTPAGGRVLRRGARRLHRRRPQGPRRQVQAGRRRHAVPGRDRRHAAGLQAKLLRALQEQEIEPLGSNKLVPFDARMIAATSRDLGAMVREGRFREDLYYRLNVLPIRVPPLRERRSRHCRAGGGAGRRHGAPQRLGPAKS